MALTVSGNSGSKGSWSTREEGRCVLCLPPPCWAAEGEAEDTAPPAESTDLLATMGVTWASLVCRRSSRTPRFAAPLPPPASRSSTSCSALVPLVPLAPPLDALAPPPDPDPDPDPDPLPPSETSPRPSSQLCLRATAPAFTADAREESGGDGGGGGGGCRGGGYEPSLRALLIQLLLPPAVAE